MRWIKAQKELESRLADCLKERVCYNFDGDELESGGYIEAFRITVDGETWFATNKELWHNKVLEYGSQHTKPKNNSYWGLTPEARRYGVIMATKETGTVSVYITEDIIQKYLNIYKIDKCLNNDNYLFRVLAVLDHRTGRRKIKKLLENIDSEPEWFRKYIILRAEAQNIYIG